METAAGKETINVLRRLIAYSEKIFHCSRDVITPLSDSRPEPRISTAAVVKAGTVLFWARMGSINAWEQLGGARFWQNWLGEPSFSADTLGRVHAVLDADGLRQGIHHVYQRLKRNKALPDIHGLGVAVLDGHESHASYLRHCSGCLQRIIHSEGGDRLQFYHRQVTLMLLPGALPGGQALRLLLDHEPQKPDEEEVGTALRLLARVILTYPRAFDVVLADALYAQAPFLNFLLDRGKHAMVVLKQEKRDLYQDVAGLFDHVAPQAGRYRSRQCSWWDFPHLKTWPQVHAPVRAIRSLETYFVHRQIGKQDDPQRSDWIWVTTLSPTQLSVERAVHLGHQRWSTNWPTNGTPITFSSTILAPSSASAGRLPRLQHLSCFSGTEREARSSPGQNPSLLGPSHRCRTL